MIRNPFKEIKFSILTTGLLILTLLVCSITVFLFINRAVNFVAKTELLQDVIYTKDLTRMALKIMLNKHSLFLETLAFQNSLTPVTQDKLEEYLFHERRKHQFEFFVICHSNQNTLSVFLPSTGLNQRFIDEIRLKPTLKANWEIIYYESKVILIYIIPVFDPTTGQQVTSYCAGMVLNQNNEFYSELSHTAHVSNVSLVYRGQLLGSVDSIDPNEMKVIEETTQKNYQNGLYHDYILSAQSFPATNSTDLLLVSYNKASKVFKLSKILHRELILLFVVLGLLIFTFSIVFTKLITEPLNHLIDYAKGLAQKKTDITFKPGIIYEIGELSQHLKMNVDEIIKSQNQLQHISDNLVDGFIYQVDSGDHNNSRRFTYISAGVEKLLGITAEDVYQDAMSIYEKVSPEEIEIFQKKELEAISTMSPFNIEAWFVSRDGQRKCLFLNSHPHLQDNDRIYWDGIALDVTERKIAEEAVQETLNKLEELNFIINNSPAYAFIWKAEENWPVAFVSENIHNLLGYPADDFLNGLITFADIVHKDDLERMNQEIEKNIEMELPKYNQEYRVVHKNGDVHWVDDRTWVKRDDQGNILYFQGILMDITDKKFAEEKQMKLTEQLMHSQKMDAIGQLAGGVAHDFNNVLAAILGSAEMLKLSQLPKEKEIDFINVIINSAKRAGELTQKLLSFSRKGAKASTPIDCLKVVSDTVSLLKHTLNKNISISLESRADFMTIIGYDSNIQNALVNMGINASHAMPDGGYLIFTLQNLVLDEEYCSASPFDIKPGTYLEISVRDTGIGMSPEIMNRIFEPFFTTKEQGKGTGLGLSMVYGMVQEHEGSINVYSEPGSGTVFHIYFPVIQGSIKTEENTEEAIHGSGTILVIDDEELIRITASAILNSLGYTVILAENGEEGIKRYRENLDQIDLIILDMIMPVMGGRETFKHIREINISVPVIIASGFAKEEDMKVLRNQGVSGFLQKPFRRSDLADLMAKTLK